MFLNNSSGEEEKAYPTCAVKPIENPDSSLVFDSFDVFGISSSFDEDAIASMPKLHKQHSIRKRNNRIIAN